MQTHDNNCWTRYYARLIKKDFGIDVIEMEGTLGRYYPLAYSCLRHRHIPPARRVVIIPSSLHVNENVREYWNRLKEKIESGVDINEYLSKKIKNWHESDSLLYSCDITHLHLRKSKKGGVGNDLVFGVFKDDSFYVLRVGGHNDMYKYDELVSIGHQAWPCKLFDMIESQPINKHDEKFIKYNANNHKNKFNLITPATIEISHSGKIISLNNHQNSAIITLTDETPFGMVEYRDLPIKSVMDYESERNYILEILYSFSRKGIYFDKLDVDFEKKNYIFQSPAYYFSQKMNIPYYCHCPIVAAEGSTITFPDQS